MYMVTGLFSLEEVPSFLPLNQEEVQELREGKIINKVLSSGLKFKADRLDSRKNIFFYFFHE